MLHHTKVFIASISVGISLGALKIRAGTNVTPLDFNSLKSNESDVLITREYKVPSSYLKLVHLKPPSNPMWLVREAAPFVPKPSVLFIESRNLLLVRATKNDQKVAERHVRQVWRVYRQKLAKGK